MVQQFYCLEGTHAIADIAVDKLAKLKQSSVSCHPYPDSGKGCQVFHPALIHAGGPTEGFSLKTLITVRSLDCDQVVNESVSPPWHLNDSVQAKFVRELVSKFSLTETDVFTEEK